MRFQLLGPVEAVHDGKPLALGGGKSRALLAVLLLHAGRVVPVDHLVDDLWGEDAPETATKMVQISVSRLRKALGKDVVATRSPGYMIDLAGRSLDLDEFEELCADGRAQLRAEPAAAAAAFRRALGLWRGPPLAEFEEPFARVEAARLEEARLGCLEDRIEADLACGRHRELVGELESLSWRVSLRPRLHEQLMLALYRSDRHAEALDAYQRRRRELDKLGIEPAQQLRELERRILQQDPSLDLAPTAESSIRQAPSRPPPAELLERDEALAALVAARDSAAGGDGRIVSVTGEPGIGKTALVNRFLQGLDPGARALVGTCDDLSIPRPLGPVHDLAGSVSTPLEEALSAGAAPHEIQSLLLAELDLAPRPTVLVLEDVHWADEATLDLITVLGRRIGGLPALLVLTFRSGEVSPGHPLNAAVGAVRAEDSVVLELAALSRRAVASLAGDFAEEVYAATGGNPFYVTELLASRTAAELPPSVANALRGRASRLDEDARRLLELVSVVPNRVRSSLLDAVRPGWAAAAVEPERRQLLEVEPTHVRFRHELARHAIQSGLAASERRRLHAEILDALLAADADPAEIVHHAEAAGARDVVADYALVAARRAAAVDSNREAYSHYRRASDFLDRLPLPEQASVLEELASAANLAERLEDALPAIEQAIRIHRGLGDEPAVGRCTRVHSRLLWRSGDGGAARAKGMEAVAILEPLGESAELARAYSGLSQLAMLAQDFEQTLAWGERALGLATALGDDRTSAHALANIGGAKVNTDPEEIAPLLEAHAAADAAGDRHEATRALLILGYSLMSWVRPAPARRHVQQAIAYAQNHEVHNLASYAAATLAWLRLRAGEWSEAEQAAQQEIDKGVSTSQLVAKTVLTALAVRRGDPDASERLADTMAQASRTGELQRLAPVLELAIDRSLTSGLPNPLRELVALIDEARPRGRPGSAAIGAAAWAAVAGFDLACERPVPPPFSAMLDRDWRAAADAFGDAGWAYDRALMLSLLADEAALHEALAIARGLGAGPLAGRVTRLLGA